MSDAYGTVFLIDDDAGVRDSLGLLLSLKSIHTQLFASAESFLGAYRPDWHGCVLTDLRMPGMSGLELQSALLRQQIELPVVVLTAHGDITTVRTALKNGALDFLEKPVEDDILLEVLQNAKSLKVPCRRTAARDLPKRVSTDASSLSERQRQVLRSVALGFGNKEIAQMLGVSAKAVQKHRGRLRNVLDLQSTAGLTMYAVREGLVSEVCAADVELTSCGTPPRRRRFGA